MKFPASQHAKGATRSEIFPWVNHPKANDRWGYRKEFLKLVKDASI